MRCALVVVIAVLAGCSDHTAPSAGSASKPAVTSCAATAAELKTFLASLVDPAGTPARPWPTGDADVDRRIEQVRQEARAANQPFDPTTRQQRLADGVKPGRLEHELAACPPALARFAHVAEVAPAERRSAFAEVADGVRACDCKLDLPMTRAIFYIVQRGPD